MAFLRTSLCRQGRVLSVAQGRRKKIYISTLRSLCALYIGDAVTADIVIIVWKKTRAQGLCREVIFSMSLCAYCVYIFFFFFFFLI